MLKKGSQAAKNYMAKIRAKKVGAVKKLKLFKPTKLELKEAVKRLVIQSKPKKLGALPVGFIGKFWGVSFKIQNQYDIYNNVEAIIEAKDTGEIITTITGKEIKNIGFKLYNYIIHTTDIQTDDREKATLKKDIEKFVKNLDLEVKKYNLGNKKISPVKNITIPAPKKLAAPKVKKSSVIKITNKAPKKIVKSGNSIQYWEIEKQKIGSIKTNNNIKTTNSKIENVTYDVLFNDEYNSNNKGFKESLIFCKKYIKMYNGTKESYFNDYKKAFVSIINNKTGNIVFTTKIK